MANLLIENYLPPVATDGLNTNKAVTFGSTLAVIGVVTFTAAPIFNGGRIPNVISGSGATVTLTAAQSGSLVLMDKVDGIVFTLPAPVVGLEYTFIATATITSNSYKVITNAGTVFMAGSVLGSIDNTANKSWVGNGTSHLAITQAAASTNATGGILGSQITVRCTTATQWNVTGMTIAGGTPTTPFATS